MRKTKRVRCDDARLERILDLLEEKGKTEKELVEHLKMGNGAFTRWKYDGSKTYLQHVGEIADYLGVNPNYLLYGEDDEVNAGTLTTSEIRLIKLYRQINTKQKECVMNTAKLFLEK